ncbi:MAG: triose-phosphate isomerase [Candidatus Dependentiae bacterium]|nr:triose-phosphate isomerase [Candidatus Dependentiae bacterium]
MGRPIFIANWKMYLSLEEVLSWCNECTDDASRWFRGATIIVCPESTHLPFTYTGISAHIQIGAQDCSPEVSGAFTGQVSAAHLHQIGLRYTIVGHQERRTYQHETTELIAQKYVAATLQGVTPIACVPDADEAERLFTQIRNAGCLPKKIICAFEPPHSIGTGRAARRDEICAHAHAIRAGLRKAFPRSRAAILYGGSVDTKNVKRLCTIDEIDGLLIGKASTNFQAFKKIVSSFMNKAL